MTRMILRILTRKASLLPGSHESLSRLPMVYTKAIRTSNSCPLYPHSLLYKWAKKKKLVIFETLWSSVFLLFLFSPGRSVCHARRSGSLKFNQQKTSMWSSRMRHFLVLVDILCVQPWELIFLKKKCPGVYATLFCFEGFFSPILHHQTILYWELPRTEGFSMWQS